MSWWSRTFCFRWSFSSCILRRAVASHHSKMPVVHLPFISHIGIVSSYVMTTRRSTAH
jgi:hypothetical protein